jgi:hypothetical protein
MSRRLPALVVGLAALGMALAGIAQGERSQRGNLIVSLDGQLSPLKLPRERRVPVTVRLDGGLQTADGETLPRVTRIELGLPAQATLSTRGLATCPQRRLRDATAAEALAACRPALVGRGRLEADVLLPNQQPFAIDAGLLAFNGRAAGRRAVVFHAFAPNPPTVVVLPFLVRPGSGRFGTALVADLPEALGPWPHFAHFEVTLSRRYRYRGQDRSYLSASCPIPPRLTAGFFSMARAEFTLADGGQLGTGIARSCRAR